MDKAKGGIHHMMLGRLNDAPKDDQTEQIGREIKRRIQRLTQPLRVTLPRRSVSCIEIPLAQ